MPYIELLTDDRQLIASLTQKYMGSDYRIEITNEAELLRLVVIESNYAKLATTGTTHDSQHDELDAAV